MAQLSILVWIYSWVLVVTFNYLKNSLKATPAIDAFHSSKWSPSVSKESLGETSWLIEKKKETVGSEPSMRGESMPVSCRESSHLNITCLNKLHWLFHPFPFTEEFSFLAEEPRGGKGKKPGRQESRYKVKLFLQSFKLSRITCLNLSETELPDSQISTSNKVSWVTIQIRSDQSLSCIQLFTTPWIAALQASLSITNSWSSLRLTSIKSVMPSSHLILCRPLLLLPPVPPSIWVFSNE